MSIDMKYPGIAGGGSDANHHGWLPVMELTWAGARRRITSAPSTRGDRESANAELSELTVTRVMDRATPALVLEACCGRGKEVMIRAGKTGDGSGTEVYLEYVLSSCLIRNYEVTASTRHGNRPMERLTLSFTKFSMRYTPYDSDGKALAPLSVGFDTATNAVV